MELSVIVPVHNGEKTLQRTIKNVLNQQGVDFELLLVENFSNDRSLEICERLSKLDPRVIVLQCYEKGTTMARRMGVEHACGEYIVFCDQDDHYCSRNALREILDKTKELSADICQFSHYIYYAPLLHKKVSTGVDSDCVLSREDVMRSHIRGVLGFGWWSNIYLDGPVWNKCYKSEVLKEAVTHIDKPIYFVEDVFLNTFAFFSPNTNKVSICDTPYYEHVSGGVQFIIRESNAVSEGL